MSGFHTTRWSVVAAAADEDVETARAALQHLAEIYWRPLFMLACRNGKSNEEAEDLVQSFFAGLLEGKVVDTADPERGSFRSYLLGAFKHHMSHATEESLAAKRGGGRVVNLDTDMTHDLAARVPNRGEFERQFDRAWALTVLDEARRRLEEDLERRERRQIELLWPHLTAAAETPYRELATILRTTEVALRVQVHRLRRRFAELIRQVVNDTLDDDNRAEDEIRALFDALS